MINNSKRKFQSSADVKKCPDAVIRFSEQMYQERMELQHLLDQRLYHHYLVERMTMKAKRVIDRLFEVYSSNLRQLPYEVYDRTRVYSKDKEKEIICNYIAADGWLTSNKIICLTEYPATVRC